MNVTFTALNVANQVASFTISGFKTLKDEANKAITEDKEKFRNPVLEVTGKPMRFKDGIIDAAILGKLSGVTLPPTTDKVTRTYKI